jgi:Fe2+ or Zn2+ uptake regulation protein
MGTTNQEIMVLNIVKKHQYIDVKILFQLTKKKMPRISKATVYRNLSKLVIQKEIFKFEVNNKSYYSTRFNQIYFVCVKCGSIKVIKYNQKIKDKLKTSDLNNDFQVSNKYLNDYCQTINTINGFTVLKTNIIIYGLCEKCQNA